jgi:hypothetical protein
MFYCKCMLMQKQSHSELFKVLLGKHLLQLIDLEHY